MVELFEVGTTENDFRGFDDVCVCWFRASRVKPVAPYQELIAGYDELDEQSKRYAESAADEFFTKEEASALATYLRGQGSEPRVVPHDFPIEGNSMGVGDLPMDMGSYGIQRLDLSTMPDYPLPFVVHGHYDTRFATPQPAPMDAFGLPANDNPFA